MLPMAGIRNGVLGRFVTPAGGGFAIFKVPAASEVLLKEVRVRNTASAVAAANVYLVAEDGSGAVVALFEEALEPGATWSWDGWAALDPNDELQLFTDQAGVHVWS